MTYEIINLEQGSQDWKNFRTNHVGASDAPVIMGISPWKNINELWREKLGLSDEKRATYAMQRGSALEATARNEFIALTGIQVKPLVVKRTDIPYISSSYDGVSDNKKTVVEIKVPVHAEYGDNVPDHYYPQLQHEMYVLDLEAIYYFSWHPENIKTIMVKRNQQYIDDMLDKIGQFWDKVLALEEPDLGLIDKSHDDAWIKKGKEIFELRELKKNLEFKLEKEEEEWREMSEYQSCHGQGMKISSYLRKGCIDYNKIPELRSLDLEKYRKPASICWKIGKYEQ